MAERADAEGAAARDVVEGLVARALRGLYETGPAAIDAVCAEHPTWADAVRARLEVLRRAGLLDAPVTERAPVRLGPYRLLRALGGGGMGVVHVALDERLDRLVALKTVRAPLEPDARARERFRREMRAVALLDHEGIVPIWDVGEDDGTPWFAMQLVEGRTLASELEERRAAVGRGRATVGRSRAAGGPSSATVGPSSATVDRSAAGGRRGAAGERSSAAAADAAEVERAARIALDVARALAHAHERGVVHRDVKPANVLVDARGRARLCDFGLAQLESDATLTQSGDLVGTPHYLAPEQVAGGPRAAGPLADVWALGVTLYELLAGRTPFEGPSAHHVFRAIEAADPPALERANPAVPRALASVVATAMEREPARRYVSAGALAEDLERYLTGRPVLATRPGAVRRAADFARRHRGPVLSAALLVGVLLAGLAAVLAALSEARASERLAEARLAETERLADHLLAAELSARAEELWPADSRAVAGLARWLADFERLAGRYADHEAFLERFEAELLAAQRAAGVVPPDATAPDFAAATLEERWKARTTRELLAGVAAARTLAAEVSTRLATARGLRERTVVAPAERWRAAAATVAADPRFGGLVLEPIEGLVPLGADPRTGLVELWHAGTGAEPSRDADGALRVGPDTGLVLVLVPGGRFDMGAEPPASDAPNVDPMAEDSEAPVHSVELAPYLVAKHEMTQGQWLRLTGANPSHHHPGLRLPSGQPATLDHPVENVSWIECERWLARADLELPTEAQWECAARAGTRTPWWTGADVASLAGAANLADAAARRAGAPSAWRIEEGLDDGHAVHAPVGFSRPSAWGLYEVHGNVSEWCRDVFDYYTQPVEGPAAQRASRPAVRDRIVRGGAFCFPARTARSSARFSASAEATSHSRGVRPARHLRPVPLP